MDQATAHHRARLLETNIGRILTNASEHADRATSATIRVLKQSMVEARLDVRDYELADSRADQLRHAREARQRLLMVRQQILVLSQDNIFGAAEVAHLSATIDQLSAVLT